MKYTTKCDTCGWVSTPKGTQAKADQALRMHRSRKHGSNQGNPGSSEEKATKRTYKKKQVAQTVTVNFCPNCGTDVHKVAVGIALAGRIK